MAAVAAILACIPMFFPMTKAWPWITTTSSANSTRPEENNNLLPNGSELASLPEYNTTNYTIGKLVAMVSDTVFTNKTK